MVNCIICHLEISEVESFVYSCPNGHQVHYECLKKWLLHSKNCPLCREPYSSEVIYKFKKFLEEMQKKEQKELEVKLRVDKITEIENATKKLVVLKIHESVENYIIKEDFESALDYLDSFGDLPITNKKGQTILFLKGKVNYHRGRYDLAINQLFRLVKENFDFPQAFLFLGKSYETLGLLDKAKWAFERVK
jgi:tetratricopeptide (TPR) repeat protein